MPQDVNSSEGVSSPSINSFFLHARPLHPPPDNKVSIDRGAFIQGLEANKQHS